MQQEFAGLRAARVYVEEQRRDGVGDTLKAVPSGQFPSADDE